MRKGVGGAANLESSDDMFRRQSLLRFLFADFIRFGCYRQDELCIIPVEAGRVSLEMKRGTDEGLEVPLQHSAMKSFASFAQV